MSLPDTEIWKSSKSATKKGPSKSIDKIYWLLANSESEDPLKVTMLWKKEPHMLLDFLKNNCKEQKMQRTVPHLFCPDVNSFQHLLPFNLYITFSM